MLRVKLKGFLYFFFVFLLYATKTLSHPHIFVDCTLSFVFDENGFAGIKERWVFDEMFSSMILNDFDKDRNLSLDSQEIVAIKKGAFSNLKNFNYFTQSLKSLMYNQCTLTISPRVCHCPSGQWLCHFLMQPREYMTKCFFITMLHHGEIKAALQEIPEK